MIPHPFGTRRYVPAVFFATLDLTPAHVSMRDGREACWGMLTLVHMVIRTLSAVEELRGRARVLLRVIPGDTVAWFRRDLWPDNEADIV